MKSSNYHFFVPLVFTLIVVFVGFQKNGVVELLYVLAGSLLFYAAPYLLWYAICRGFNVNSINAHIGYIAASLALLAIASVWLLPPDPSGLPLQWAAYWPLSAIMMSVFLLMAYVYKKVRNT